MMNLKGARRDKIRSAGAEVVFDLPGFVAKAKRIDCFIDGASLTNGVEGLVLGKTIAPRVEARAAREPQTRKANQRDRPNPESGRKPFSMVCRRKRGAP